MSQLNTNYYLSSYSYSKKRIRIDLLWYSMIVYICLYMFIDFRMVRPSKITIFYGSTATRFPGISRIHVWSKWSKSPGFQARAWETKQLCAMCVRVFNIGIIWIQLDEYLSRTYWSTDLVLKILIVNISLNVILKQIDLTLKSRNISKRQDPNHNFQGSVYFWPCTQSREFFSCP